MGHKKNVYIFIVLFLCFCVSLRPKIENKEPDTWNDRRRTRWKTLLTMNPYIPTDAASNTHPHQKKKSGMGKKIMVWKVVKAKVGELEDDIREGFLRRSRKEMTGVVQEIVGKIRYLVRFQDRLEKEISSNYLTIMVVRSEVEKEIGVREVDIIPDVREELGCYHWVYIYLHFIKEYGVYKRDEHICADPDTDEEEIEDVVIYDER